MTALALASYTATGFSSSIVAGTDRTVIMGRECDGLLVLDKPLGVTSRAAVDQAQRWFPRGTRVGHAGTLDPLATGVLVLTVGQATRLTEYVQSLGKTYVADVVLGARSATDDAEGPITPVAVDRPPSRAAIDAALPAFLGTIAQVPPAYSAVKLAGQRAYDLSRRGKPVELTPRSVRIDRIEVQRFEFPDLRLEIACGKGTYIRSLARDLGERLGCGAYLAALRRTRIGAYPTDLAVPLDADAETARQRLLPLTAAVAGLPSITVEPDVIVRIRHGQRVSVTADSLPGNTTLAVLGPSGGLVAVATSDNSGQTLRPVKVFPP
jgi:tRNA pseudouridine55 synthase